LTRVHMDEFRIPSEQLRKGMLPGAKLDVFFPGFPTLKHIPHHAELSKEGVKVFQMNSRGYNTMLYIEQEEEEPDIDKVAKEYLGREIYVGWPHMYEAKVIAVSNSEYSYTQEEPAGGKGKAGNHRPQIKREQIDESTYTIYSKEISTIAERYKDRLGIVIGDTHILLRALPMTGRKYIFSSHGRVTMDKQFGKLPVAFAKQATVKDIAVHDSGFCQFRTLKDYLPEGTAVFMLGWPHYACQGEVIETDTESGRVRINLSILEEPQLSNVINHQQIHPSMVHADRYYSGYVVAQKVGISSHLLSRLTGTIYVTAGEAELAREQANPHKVNVGLNLKFTKRGEEVPGYTKNTEGQWTYSDKVVDVLSQYMDKFPEMFESISKSNKQHNDMYYESDLIPKTCDYTLKTVEEFIKKLPCSGLKTMKSGADIISEGTIKALQELTDQVVEANKKRQKRVKMQVKPHLLYKPSPTSGSLIPDQSATYQLYDRVVNTRQGFPVPFGLRGTVVGIHPAEVEVNTMYEVIFDDDFQGGISIRNSSKRGYRMPPSGLLNITHGERKNGVKSAIQIPVAAKKTRQNQGPATKEMLPIFFVMLMPVSPRQPGPHQYNQGYGGQQGFQRNQGGYQGLPDNRTGYHDNQFSRGGNQQWDRQARSGNQAGYSRQNDQYERQNNRNTQDTKEDVSGQVFNGASAGTSQPTFVTPKVTSGNQSKRKLSTGESQQNKPGKGQTSGSTEFDNIWKQLQASQPPAADNSSQGLSLSSAAAVLPRVPSPDNASKGSNLNQNNTKIDVQSLFSGASNANDTKTIQPGAQNAKSDSKSQYSSSKVVSNDEFAAMFKSLEEVHISKEENENKPENGTDALKKMLNITDQSESSKGLEAPADGGGASSGGGGKSYGRQVSIQELFDGAKKQQVQSDVDKSQEQQNKGKGYQKQKGQGQQSPRQPQGHQGQQQGFQNNVQNKRPALLIPQSRGGNRNPVMELMSFCQSLQMGLPMYDYIPKSGVFYCVVSLFNGARFQGSLCKTKEEAAESAASVALLQLKGSMQQMAAHPMMQMPGFVPGALPQGRQFSSPNSAFSPVNTFPAPGIYQGNRGQSPRGYHGYGQQQQQRPFSGGQGQTHYNRGGYSRQQNNSANQQQGRNQTYQNPAQEMTTSQQQGRNQTYQNPQDLSANQNQESKTDERSLFNSQKQSKDVKTQPTCVVTPFVPMQVTRKHTPQKARKTSVSDDNTSRIEEETLEKRGENIPVREVKGDNSMQSNKPKTDSSETISSKPDPSNSRTERKESGSTDSTSPKTKQSTPPSPKTKQSTPPKSAKKTETGSAKKSRRRLAANFNVKP
ncbi:5'-3' exoribonuclease 1-like, partial [Ruditapes philippinarum]|uniref:5'-3' exoribonuclease 1-like n=1 Tax=Ruditapes philippinarum TaxID=129788 RepID=UPI00295A76FD